MAGSISFSGMASGLDTDSMVEAMVSNYQNKVDASTKQETLLEWKQEIYKEVSSKVYKFYTGTINNLRLASTFNKKLLTSSNTTALKLDSSSTAAAGTHTLKNLKRATGASIQTYQMPKVADNKTPTSSTKLSELGLKDGQTIEFTDANGKKTKIVFKDTTAETESSEAGTIQGAGTEQGDMTIKDGSSNSSGNTKPEEDKLEVVELSLTENISALQSALKSALPSASVSFDGTAGAFFISSSSTGASQSFTISGDTEALRNLGFIGKSTEGADDGKGNAVTYGADKITTITAQGSDASYTYNGIEMTSESNNISINGLKFTILSDTEEAITISSESNVDGMIDTIKSFVEEYNTLIGELNDLVNADSAGSYEPLLDSEKEGMTDSQIEKWEKKIKDSLLRNDSTLKSLTSSMRSILSGTLSSNSTYKSLASIGITTSSDWTANGKLELDEDKLREALTNKPEEVIELFTANGDGSDSSTKGLGDKLYETLGNSFKRISSVKTATSLFSDTLLTTKRTAQAKTTSKLEDRLETMKEIYYKKFSAMETALSKLNAQTDSLTSLLSS